MLLENKHKIGGRVVAIGKVSPDGTRDVKWLDKPKHNMIVASGFDHLFHFCKYLNRDQYTQSYVSVANSRITFIGGSTTRDYNRNYEYTRQGCLQYCRIGTNGDATAFTDTELKSPCSSYSSSIENGFPWTYAFTGPNGNGDYYIRVTHRVTANQTGQIREIGWYGYSSEYKNYGTTGTYSLFSRVVLDEPYEITSGEEMIICYELHIQYADLTPVPVLMNGLVATDGTPLRAMKGFESQVSLAQSSGNIPYINYSRFGFINTDATDTPGMGSHYSVYSYAVNRISYYTSDRNFHADRNPWYGSGSLTKATVAPLVTVGLSSGVPTNRVTFTVPGTWPNLSGTNTSIDIHLLNIDGYTYRFGYYDNDTWVPQALRKYYTDNWQITEKITYVPDDE